MKKIALIMDGWKRFFTYAWPSGILERIRETNEQVNLYIFNSSGGWSRDEEYNYGEYNIYNLPNLNDFDGIIMDLNNICYASVRENVVRAARATGKPVVSIANDIEGCYYVGIDNYSAMQEIIAHLHKEHGCKKFWFVMGESDNYENIKRIEALQDYMDEHEIPWKKEQFYCESFEYKCGVNGFEQLYRENKELPDAIICGSDNIAVGVCETAAKYGFSVPQDVRVTGFDDFDKASYYSPRLTTVAHVREDVGYCSADILIKLWRNEEVEHFNYTSHNSIYRESCGCKDDDVADQIEHSRGQIVYGIETDEFEEQVLSLEYELLRCETLAEMFHWIPRCIPAMRCDAMYLIIDKHMDDFKHINNYYERYSGKDEEFNTDGYPNDMKVEFAYENGRILEEGERLISGIFPMFDTKEGGKDFLFLPLHFRAQTVGYFVIRNAVYLMEKQYLFRIMNVLTSAMENLHKKETLAHLNQTLSNLYVRDAMTGIYNRLGYQNIACKLFEEKKRLGEDITILYIDMDRLKFINDQYGHLYGDMAIKAIVNNILQNIPENSIAIRMGGDEFLIVLMENAVEKIEAMVQNMRSGIKKAAVQMKLPFPLTISVGGVLTDMSTDKTLDDYAGEADENMYHEKVEKKANRQ